MAPRAKGSRSSTPGSQPPSISAPTAPGIHLTTISSAVPPDAAVSPHSHAPIAPPAVAARTPLAGSPQSQISIPQSSVAPGSRSPLRIPQSSRRPRQFTRQSESFRSQICLPGLLAPAVEQRRAEFRYDSVSPYVVELVCFDLRRRVPHIVSLPLSRDTLPAQDAVDRLLVSHYRPHSPRNGPLRRLIERTAAKHRHDPVPPPPAAATPAPQPQVPPAPYPASLKRRVPTSPQSAIHDPHSPAPALPRVPLAAARFQVRFPGKLKVIIKERWQELGYESLSAYVTGLVRYDLLYAGPHKHFDGTVSDPKTLAFLDDHTLSEYLRQGASEEGQQILLDYWIHEILGRKPSEVEKEAHVAEVLGLLKQEALRNAGDQRRTT